MLNKIKQGDLKCGEGPVLYYGPAVQNNLLDLIISSAEKNKIPFQQMPNHQKLSMHYKCQ